MMQTPLQHSSGRSQASFIFRQKGSKMNQIKSIGPIKRYFSEPQTMFNVNCNSMGVKEGKGTGKTKLSPAVAWKCQPWDNWLFPSSVYSTKWEVSLRIRTSSGDAERLISKLFILSNFLALSNFIHVLRMTIVPHPTRHVICGVWTVVCFIHTSAPTLNILAERVTILL